MINPTGQVDQIWKKEKQGNSLPQKKKLTAPTYHSNKIERKQEDEGTEKYPQDPKLPRGRLADGCSFIIELGNKRTQHSPNINVIEDRGRRTFRGNKKQKTEERLDACRIVDC